MITDFFSHKIHSSTPDWPDKLVELAHLFHEFDGQLYDRDAIEHRLTQISSRSSFVARDASKFRDEFSAYPAYFGLYHLMPSNAGWIITTTETTKRFLLTEEPDVASFLRLQLTLFQFPNGMGAAYYANSTRLRIQANARNKTLSYIRNGVHLSPLRLIIIAMLADTRLRSVPLLESKVSLDEVFTLANQSDINQVSNPSIDKVSHYLELARNNHIHPPNRYEKRFHLLRHLELFSISQQQIQLRETINQADEIDLEAKFLAIAQVNNQFNEFDQVTNGEELEEAIKSGTWAQYFDALNTISPSLIHIISSDLIIDLNVTKDDQTRKPVTVDPVTYPLKPRDEVTPKPKRASRKQELADPEVTRIKRQRRNLVHKILVDRFDQILRTINASPLESQHIDLCALIPNDGTFVFEMKSGGTNLLAQIRKGLSQLYEYRFRYKDLLTGDITLCMVLAEDPTPLMPWIEEYLCVDRNICLCWYRGNNLIIPEQCRDRMQILFTN